MLYLYSPLEQFEIFEFFNKNENIFSFPVNGFNNDFFNKNYYFFITNDFFNEKLNNFPINFSPNFSFSNTFLFNQNLEIVKNFIFNAPISVQEIVLNNLSNIEFSQLMQKNFNMVQDFDFILKNKNNVAVFIDFFNEDINRYCEHLYQKNLSFYLNDLNNEDRNRLLPLEVISNYEIVLPDNFFDSYIFSDLQKLSELYSKNLFILSESFFSDFEIVSTELIKSQIQPPYKICPMKKIKDMVSFLNFSNKSDNNNSYTDTNSILYNQNIDTSVFENINPSIFNKIDLNIFENANQKLFKMKDTNLVDNIDLNLFANIDLNVFDTIDTTLYDKLDQNLFDNIELSLFDNIEDLDNMDSNLFDKIDLSLLEKIHPLLFISLDPNLLENIDTNLYDKIDLNLFNAIDSNLFDNIDLSLYDNIDANLYDKINQSLFDNIDLSLFDNIDLDNIDSNLFERSGTLFLSVLDQSIVNILDDPNIMDYHNISKQPQLKFQWVVKSFKNNSFFILNNNFFKDVFNSDYVLKDITFFDVSHLQHEHKVSILTKNTGKILSIFFQSIYLIKFFFIFLFEYILNFCPMNSAIPYTLTILFFIIFFFFFFLLVFFFFPLIQIFLIFRRSQFYLYSYYLFFSNIIKDLLLAEMSKKYYFHLISWLFVTISFINILGLIPNTFVYTSQFSFTFFNSFIYFLTINCTGVLLHGMTLFSLFFPTGAPIFIAPLLVVIESISYFARIFSLAIRLFANITAGHILLKIISSFVVVMINLFFAFIISFSLIALLWVLEFFIGILQAYVFTILVCIYLNDVILLH